MVFYVIRRVGTSPGLYDSKQLRSLIGLLKGLRPPPGSFVMGYMVKKLLPYAYCHGVNYFDLLVLFQSKGTPVYRTHPLALPSKEFLSALADGLIQICVIFVLRKSS